MRWICTGLRRMRWLCWNALESTDCAELRRLRWNSAYSLAHSQYYPVLRPRFCSLQFPGSACRAKVLGLTAGSSSRSPAISLQLSVREINNSGQKLNVLLF